MWPPLVRSPWRTNARRSGGESDVGHPHLVHAIGREVATDRILGDPAPQRVNGGGHRPAPSADARDRGPAHQRRSPPAARMTLGTQCGMDARRAVGAMGDGMNGADTAKRAASRLCRADCGRRATHGSRKPRQPAREPLCGWDERPGSSASAHTPVRDVLPRTGPQPLPVCPALAEVGAPHGAGGSTPRARPLS